MKSQESISLTMSNFKCDYPDGGHGLTANPNVKVYHDGLKGLVKNLKKAVKRRAAVEPLIGHLKSDGHLGRNYLKGKQGDRINALMAAVGYNFRLILKWIRTLLCFFMGPSCQSTDWIN